MRMISQAYSFMHSWVSPTNNVDSIIVNNLDQSDVTLLSQVCHLCHPCNGLAMITYETVWYFMILLNTNMLNGWNYMQEVALYPKRSTSGFHLTFMLTLIYIIYILYLIW